MKKLFLLIAANVISVSLWAKCASSGLYFFPSGPYISSNPVIVIDGYATDQQTIRDLSGKHAAWLISGKEKIKLIVQETLEGQYGLTQAVLKPEHPLKKGMNYKLHIDGIPKKKAEAMLRRYQDDKWTTVSWTVSRGEKKFAKPEWASTPVKSGEEYTMFGCGPAVYVNFDVSVRSEGQYLVKTIVADKASGKETAYYLPVENGKIRIGHGMCSGAFNFAANSTYSVYFQVMNEKGDVSLISGRPMSFEAPKMS
jgi:hypothetical protein